MCHAYQVGVIVPSSNVTMETEIPALLRARDDLYGGAFTFHSSRMRMQSVTREELERMDEQSERCAGLLADARCDVQAYACLVGITAGGPGYHEESESTLEAVADEEGGPAPVVTSANASGTPGRSTRRPRTPSFSPRASGCPRSGRYRRPRTSSGCRRSPRAWRRPGTA